MATPDSRAPVGGIGEWYRGAGGLRLRVGYWPCARKARGTVFISPGRSEPIEKYYEVIADLLKRDFAVVAHDWRGQGLSARLLPDRLKGHARGLDEYLDDFTRLLDDFEGRAPKPWLMIGHSMGAALNLATLQAGESRISGAVFTSPMLRLKTGRHAMWSVRFRTNWMVKHGHSADYVPEIFDDPFEHSFEKDALTHDQRRYDIWQEHLFACPHLAVGTPTWGWLAFALHLGSVLMRDKDKALKKVRAPITILCGAADSLINPRPCRNFVRKLGNGRYFELQGAQHELWVETDEFRRQVWEEFDELAASAAPVGGVVAEKRDEPATALVPATSVGSDEDIDNDVPEDMTDLEPLSHAEDRVGDLTDVTADGQESGPDETNEKSQADGAAAAS